MVSNQKSEPEYKKVKRSLRYLTIDGAFHSIMDGFTASFIAPYAIALNASNLIISLLSSVPDLAGSLFQLLAIKANQAFRSKKIIIVISALIQAALWLPILFIPKLFQHQNQAIALVALYSLLMMFGYFMSPLWRGFVGELVSENERGTYFGMRNKIIAAMSFISSITAGLILQKYSSTNALLGFTILFAVAFFARIISAAFLALMHERQVFNPNRHSYTSYEYTLSRFIKDLTTSDYGKFVLFICLFRISVSIAGPFFAVYEFKYLGFSYLQYTALIAIEIISNIVFLGFWGWMNDERGSKTVIILSSLLIPMIPLGYAISPNYTWLIIVSIISGAGWAGFNLAVGNFMFDASSPQERVRYASYYQLFNGTAVFIGSLAGGLLLSFLPQAKESIILIFIISGVGRLVVAFFLFPSLREMRLVELPFGKKFFEYPLIIKPRHRFVQDPFDYYLAYPNRPKRPRPRLYIDADFVIDKKELEEQAKKEKIEEKRFVEKMIGQKK